MDTPMMLPASQTKTIGSNNFLGISGSHHPHRRCCRLWILSSLSLVVVWNAIYQHLGKKCLRLRLHEGQQLRSKALVLPYLLANRSKPNRQTLYLYLHSQLPSPDMHRLSKVQRISRSPETGVSLKSPRVQIHTYDWH